VQRASEAELGAANPAATALTPTIAAHATDMPHHRIRAGELCVSDLGRCDVVVQERS
jgi:hypothetical protein